jgi:hypothetical protein
VPDLILFNKILLMLHFIGLAMGFSVAFANIVMAIVMSKAAPQEKPILGRFPLAMSKVGYIGLTVLWVTGVTMVFTRWHGFSTLPPTFHMKLTAVVLLTITVGYIHAQEIKLKKGNTTALARIEKAGKASALFALIAVIFAVLTFN